MVDNYIFSTINVKDGRFVSAIFQNNAGKQIVADLDAFSRLVPPQPGEVGIPYDQITRAAVTLIHLGVDLKPAVS